MAFLRFSRDKRGYEHFYLVEPAGRGKSRPRVLFWFRTPPNIKVGRKPFAADVRRTLEERYPDVTFDWTAIVETPIPPPVEPERWRERRRLERAMRAAQNEEDAGTPADSSAETSQPRAAARTARAEIASGSTEESAAARDGSATSNLMAADTPDMPAAATRNGRPRRRKRRRRGRKGPVVPAAPVEMSGVQSLEEPAVQDSEEPDGDRADEA